MPAKKKSLKRPKTKKAGVRVKTVNGETVESKVVALFEEVPAQVNVTLGATIKLTEYNFAKVSVGVTYPCLPKDIKRTFKALSKEVAGYMKEEIQKIDEEREDAVEVDFI